jgi:hypothetical protein
VWILRNDVSTERKFLKPYSQQIGNFLKLLCSRSAIGTFFLCLQCGLQRVFPEINDCLSSSISAAQDNPYHVDNAFPVGNILSYYCRQDPRRDFYSFIERMLDEEEWTICTNDGISHANAVALRTTFISFKMDSDQFEQWNPTEELVCDRLDIFFQRRLKIVRRLTKNIRDHVPDILDLNSTETFGDVVACVMEALQSSLIYASRMKGLRGTSNHVSFVRRCVVEEATTMLDVVQLCLEALEDRMLDWCEEWEVLDVWVESLRRHGVQIPRKTRKVWKENKIYYDYLDIRKSTAT